MKKLLVFMLLLLLCLSLAACEKDPPPMETDPQLTLPAITDRQSEPSPIPTATEPITAPTSEEPSAPSTSERTTAPSGPESIPAPSASEAAPAPSEPAAAEDVPVLSVSRTNLYGAISGPAGTVNAVGVLAAECRDPVYGDVDGDGQKELIYHSGSRSDADELNYRVVSVYGLEEGWPVCEAWIFLSVGEGSLQLAEDGENVLCRYTPKGGETVSLPLTLKNDRVILNGGGPLPDGLFVMSNSNFPMGWSFQRLRAQIGDKLLCEQPGCLVWQEPGVFYTQDDLSEQYLSYVYAAVSDNGVTMTNYFLWVESRDGKLQYGGSDLGSPIPPVEDPNALLGLTEAELTDRLGPFHFKQPASQTDANRTVLCWITEDGRLLTVQLAPSSAAALTDLLPQH